VSFSGRDQFVMHSLFLHIGVETGAVGLALVIGLYLAVISRSLRHYQITKEIVPLVFALCCLADSLSHNSFDPFAGVFAGLALTDLSRFVYIRPARFAQPRRAYLPSR
jgi:O-antigen ligase